MDRLDAMRVFVAVARRKSFAAAARDLGLSRPTVSRAIAALEDVVAAELLIRTTRSVALSQVGESYLSDCERILEDVAEAEAAASGSYKTPMGELILTAPVTFGRLHVLPVIERYAEAHPEVRVRAVFLDRVTHLVDEGFDLAVRISDLEDSGHVAVRVGEVTPTVVASPDYLERFGKPRTPSDIEGGGHVLVGQTGPRKRTDWKFSIGGRIHTFAVEPRLVSNDVQSVLIFASRGCGMARVLSYQGAELLESGRLVRVLGEYEVAPIPVHLVWPGGRRTSARTRAFVDTAVDLLRAASARGWRSAPS